MTHKFDQVILSYDFQINDSDKCVYVKFFYDNGCVILALKGMGLEELVLPWISVPVC